MTIGLEIHAELNTQSKMFCGCKNSSFNKEDVLPNTNICPICMGYPGTLPVINKEAVRSVLLVGKAIGSNLADFTEFDRKNYFYPDIPKGYQISQYKFPLIKGGSIAGVLLTRIHLEEDTARSSHDTPGVSLVDYNRAGVPLLELVTEPVIHSSDEAMNFAKELQLLLQYLNVSDANMEKGEMRVEVNISVSSTPEFGTKVEVKNINSFRAAGKAIDYEFKRQTALLEKGERVVQETRGWDENKGSTFSQRLKESANDYRYFPDPDLPKLILSEVAGFRESELLKTLPETPAQKRERFSKVYGIKVSDIEVYINNILAGKFFEEVAESLNRGELIQSASNYITSDIVGFSKNLKQDFSIGNISKESFVGLIKMIGAGELSSRGAKDVLKVMFEVGGNPSLIAKEKELIQKSDIEEIKKMAEKIVRENPDSVSEYKNGKESLLQFFVGQGMKESGGAVNPEVFKKIVLEILKS
ncbi:MAG: aspartyl-tRNA(Asn)/glutamyl-tRNA (Gln) amidotransferase subunit B [Parcubacteria group bacterium Gr01-1014_46]|nr:MAG: aspartyl-tRNA(Asn)/glutamyl-tRNA (Gln) amidotransferase subunit B [Parcubacteria group bacterium Gr01-1014_46]